ncbi:MULTISPECIES: hypothetical protein [unclassified Amycolatopsis]|uniref:hypothetical protein n=1 Tax=unclassified Amycolatopsis TaxID=2618356 RepID=UPI002874B6B5|nr:MULTISPECIES: hypothetical protein [unclassified Amycolatopsis]MDS0137559.1 hypothetical protein [Amycolatopsis sp. 505]MDS0141754.1 hypothetical protein [Amycolatopsis sp. CM201R]
MSFDKRVARWAKKTCTVLNAVRTVVVATRRLLVTVCLLSTTVIVWMNGVMPGIK